MTTVQHDAHTISKLLGKLLIFHILKTIAPSRTWGCTEDGERMQHSRAVVLMLLIGSRGKSTITWGTFQRKNKDGMMDFRVWVSTLTLCDFFIDCTWLLNFMIIGFTLTPCLHCALYGMLIAYFTLPPHPPHFTPSLGCVWWSDVIITMSFFKEGSRLNLSSLNVLKRCLGHCGAPLPVWAKEESLIWHTSKLWWWKKKKKNNLFFLSLSVLAL